MYILTVFSEEVFIVLLFMPYHLSELLFYRRKGNKEKVVVYDSDDENAYKGQKQPDPSAEDYYMDDIDEFHARKDKVGIILYYILPIRLECLNWAT